MTVEFRCGSDLDALQKYFTGPYAYWLSAGIDANADVQTIDNVIDLFVTENLSGEYPNRHPPYTKPQAAGSARAGGLGFSQVCAAPSALMTAPVT